MTEPHRKYEIPKDTAVVLRTWGLKANQNCRKKEEGWEDVVKRGEQLWNNRHPCGLSKHPIGGQTWRKTHRLKNVFAKGFNKTLTSYREGAASNRCFTQVREECPRKKSPEDGGKPWMGWCSFHTHSQDEWFPISEYCSLGMELIFKNGLLGAGVCLVGRALALPVVNLGSIPATPYGSLGPPEAIPGCQARS